MIQPSQRVVDTCSAGTNCQATSSRQLPSTCLRTDWTTIGTMWALKAAEASSAYLHSSIKYKNMIKLLL